MGVGEFFFSLFVVVREGEEGGGHGVCRALMGWRMADGLW